MMMIMIMSFFKDDNDDDDNDDNDDNDFLKR